MQTLHQSKEKPEHRPVLPGLIAAASTGDATAFGEIVAEFQDTAVGYAYALLGDHHLAEDVAQEAFVAAWQLLPQLREAAAFPAWLRRIVFKHADRHRRRGAIAALPLGLVEDEASEEPGPAALAEAEAWRDELHGLIADLPEHERTVVTLFYFSGAPLKFIGRFLDLPESTLKSRLHSARKRLRTRMLSMLEDELQSHRPSRDGNFTRAVMTMIRPSDQELSAGSGTLGCQGADVWATISASASGDATALRELLRREPNLARAEYWYTGPLHYAVREGHLKCVQLLLEAGADPSAIRYCGETLPIVARDRGHEEVARLIEKAQQNALGGKPVDGAIHLAVTAGDIDQVRAELDAHPAAISSRDAHGLTPLHLAVAGAHTEIVKLLLERGADMEAATGAGGTYASPSFTPLDMAIWESDFWIGVRGNWAMVDLLLEHGAAYPLVIAAARGDANRVEEILAGDPSQLNVAQPSGRRALSSAIQFGHLDLAKRLLEAGADPNLPEGRFVPRGAALYFAARDRHYEMVSLLLGRGADPRGSIDSCGLVWHVADAAIRLELYRHGLKVTEFDLNNIDALALWADKDPVGLGHADCGGVFTMVVKNEWAGFPNPTSDERKEALLHMLLGKGVRVPAVVTGCRTYLWHKPKFTRILLEHDMDPNLPNWQRVTPLHNICGLGGRGEPDENRLELAALFLEFGADINARDEEYRSTPLGWAARSGLMDMVELLLERGAAVQLPDDEPWATPLAWAKKRGHADIAAVLRERGATH